MSTEGMHNLTGINNATGEQDALSKTMQQTLHDYELKIKQLEAGLQAASAHCVRSVINYHRRACICDVGEFDAGAARLQSTIKKTKYYLKPKHI